MDGSSTPWRTTTRSALVATVSVGLGASGHVAAGGTLPGPVGLGLLTLLTGLIAAAVLGRKPSVPRVALLVVAGQAGLHACLGLIEPSPTLIAGHHGALAAQAAATHAEHGAGAMAALHLLAGLLVAAWLLAGERLTLRLVRAAGLGVHRAVALLLSGAVAETSAPRPVPAVSSALPRASLLLLARCLVRRGPPALLAA